jgi:hypothetical protein
VHCTLVPVCIPATAGLNLCPLRAECDAVADWSVVVAVSMRIGTRKSVMALAQTEDIAQRLSRAAPN